MLTRCISSHMNIGIFVSMERERERVLFLEITTLYPYRSFEKIKENNSKSL